MDAPVLLVSNTENGDLTNTFYLYEDTENGGYYIVDKNQYVFTTAVVDYDTIMNDPKNYYGTYMFGDANNVVTINSDNTANLIIDGQSTTVDYFYANKSWIQKNLQKDYDGAIILYANRGEQQYIFAINSDGNLLLADQFTFVKQ